MNYHAVLEIKGDNVEKLLDSLSGGNDKKRGRSDMNIELVTNVLRISIVSPDPTSLRAAINSILMAATVFEKINKVR